MITDSYIAHFIAMFIVFVIACSFSVGWAKADGTKPLSDKFELGYIEDSPIQYVTVQEPYDELKELERAVKLAKLKKQLKELHEPTPTKAPVKQAKAPVKQAKAPAKQAKAPAKQVVQKEDKDNLLFTDCKDALVGLGVPARKAKADVQNVFDQNPNIKTVQQFITEYGKRCA